MSITTVLLWVVIIAIITTVTIILINERKNQRKHPETIKPLRNKLSRFCHDHERGQLIEMIPIGKEKKLRKIIYSAKNKDKFGKDELKYERIIVHTDQIKNTDKEITLLPINPEELDPRDAETPLFQEYLKKNLEIDLMSKAITNDRKAYERVFQTYFGSQTQAIVMQELENRLKLLKSENVEENKPKVKP